MTKEEVKKLFHSEKFLKDLEKVNSMTSLQGLLANHGINMNMSDMDKAIEKGAGREMSEEELGCVAGGFAFTWFRFAWDCFMYNATKIL